jgi:hypothetical protein
MRRTNQFSGWSASWKVTFRKVRFSFRILRTGLGYVGRACRTRSLSLWCLGGQLSARLISCTPLFTFLDVIGAMTARGCTGLSRMWATVSMLLCFALRRQRRAPGPEFGYLH